jgi:hypothetical protein
VRNVGQKQTTDYVIGEKCRTVVLMR